MAPTNIGHFEKVRALAADARRVAVGGARAGAGSRVTVYDSVANKVLATLDLPTHVHALAWVPKRADTLLAACADGHLVAITVDGNGARVTRDTLAHAGACTALAVNATHALCAGADGVLSLWETSTWSVAGRWTLSPAALRAAAIEPDGARVAGAGDDGVVRVITVKDGARREMSGHEGAVFALAFTPRDGRLASAGDDALIRLWYLEGEVECEVRGNDDTGHKGAVYALVFSPPPAKLPDGTLPGDRLFSASADGKVKAWRLEDRRKPRTVDAGPLAVHALAFAPPASNARGTLGALWAGNEGRGVSRFTVDATGALAENRTLYGNGFEVVAADLQRKEKPARDAAVDLLAAMEEREALEILSQSALGHPEVDTRARIAKALGDARRTTARSLLRSKLSDVAPTARRAALDALRAIEGDGALGPLRAALDAPHPDLRVVALRALAALRGTSPLVPGMVLERLTDPDASVRRAAFDGALALYEDDRVEALRVAFERGAGDVKVLALLRALADGHLAAPAFAPLVTQAHDDADPAVRRAAFTARVLARAALARTMSSRDEGFRRLESELLGSLALLLRGAAEADKNPSREELDAARAAIQTAGRADAALSDEDLEPLLTALACRTPDTALRGARALAMLGDVRALGALLQLTREADPALRREAALALRSLDDPRARRRLVWMLDDADADVRGAALDAYATMTGVSPADVAEAALRSPQQDIRVRGLERLVKLGAGDPAHETLLADAIEDEAEKVRGEAFRTLWAWHAKDPAVAIDRALGARFPDVRRRAVDELATHAKHPWAQERLLQTITDRDAAVALAAYDVAVKAQGEAHGAAHLSALDSTQPAVRAAGARGAAKCALDEVRAALMKRLADEQPEPRVAALETLDKLSKDSVTPHHSALQESHIDLRVRAAELLAARHDEALIEPMRALLADAELPKRLGAAPAAALRQRAASALATLGATKLVKYFATELLKDDDALVREHAARGLATASRRGDEGYLLDALGHADAWVRSWAADGLSRLGDPRALPVLVGNLRHDHLPIRQGAVLSFAALGPEGYGGMLQGLEDPSLELQEMVFAVILARDLRAFRKGEAPDLLASALSSQRAEVRFAAARALELRGDPERYMAHLIEVLAPPKAEGKAAKEGPSEESRARVLAGLAEALASDTPEQRYAAAQALSLKKRPAEYLREAERAARLRALSAPWVPDTAPRAPGEEPAKPRGQWLRRLFMAGEDTEPRSVPTEEQSRLQRLAFGAYVGLLRQVGTTDEDSQRVRRDAIERVVDLALRTDLGSSSAVPPLARALDDPNHLVRRAAYAGLKQLFHERDDSPYTLALSSQSADVARAALDEIAARGEPARPRLVAALDARIPEVRRHAFDLLESLSPKDSLDPLLAAISSAWDDLRMGVIERLARSTDARVASALRSAAASEHENLRLRAAELLVDRRDDHAVDVLASFVRADDPAVAERARAALVRLASDAAVTALAQRLDELEGDARLPLVTSLRDARNPSARSALVARFDDESPAVRAAALDAVVAIGDRALPREVPEAERDAIVRAKRDHAWLGPALDAAVRARDPELRARAAGRFTEAVDERADATLAGLFTDRERAVRKAAVEAYASRVIHRGADAAPLDAVLRAGAREHVLPAAEALAHKGIGAALHPLLLVSRAGDPDERRRALLALGTLGDPRALDELELLASGGTEDAPVEPEMRGAAFHALGRMANKLTDPTRRAAVIERVEQASVEQANVVVRSGALFGVAALGGERARARLESTLLDESAASTLRRDAAAGLALVKDPAAEAALAQALLAYDTEVSRAAQAALRKLFPGERTRVALLAVTSVDDEIAGEAARFLATEGDPSVLVARLPAIQNPELRARLRYGLVRRAAAPLDALASLLAHDDPAVLEEAAWILGARTAVPASEAPPLDRAALGPVADALRRALAEMAARVATAAGARRDQAAHAWPRLLWTAQRLALPEAGSLARDALSLGERCPAEARREAARALGQLPPDEAAVAALTRALSDLDAAVRAAAAASLESALRARAATVAAAVTPVDPVAFGVTTRAVTSADPLLRNEIGRRLALPSLIARRDVAGLVDLARAADVDPATRGDALDALGRCGGDAATEALGAMAFDKKWGDVNQRKRAYRAWRRALRLKKATAAEATR